MAGGDARYAHLLQPVKDLIHNWEIDVASNLEMYLEELADTEISFDGGNTTLDFAEAALIIQSSACVYSKKVDYLRKLVDEMLEIVANRRKAKKGDTSEHGTELEVDDDEEFLSLDDEGFEYERVYLKEDLDSEKEFQFLPEVPLSVMPTEDDDIGEDPLLSDSGEVLASRKDFMINKSYVDEKTGILLIQLSYQSMLDQLVQSSSSVQQVLQDDPVTMETDGGRTEVIDTGGGDDIGCDDDGPALDISMPDHQEEDPTIRENHRASPNPENLAEVSEGRKLRTREERVTQKKQQIDPLQLLDQYEELKPKPHAKKVNIVKMPPCLIQEDKSKKRKRNNQKPPPVMEPLNVYMANTMYSNVRKYPKSWPKNHIDLAFDTIIWKEHKRRLSILQKQEEKKRQNRNFSEVEDEAEEEEDWDRPDSAGVDDNDMEDLEPLEDDRLFEAIDEGLRAVEEFRQNSPIARLEEEDGDCMEASATTESYEDMLRQYLEDYMTAARRYEQTSDLSLRVADWQNKVEPLLSGEELREAFDVNTYGERVIDNLAEGSIVKFGKVVEGRTNFDVCRIFLVTLMMANTHNVEICNTLTSESTENFGIQLLSSRRHFEEIQDFQAPSIEPTQS